jgi:hypothetical protein
MVVGMTEAGQCCDEPLHEEEEGRSHPGRFGRARPRGSPTADEMMAFDGQDATQGRLDVFWRMWQCAGIIWHVWQLAGALEGPTFCLLDADIAQKGPTSPSEGPDVSLLAHNFDILAFNVTNNVTIVSQPCRLF